jgi:hypothetical protein
MSPVRAEDTAEKPVMPAGATQPTAVPSAQPLAQPAASTSPESSPSAAPSGEPTPVASEEPELPPSLLVLPEDDPNFKPDPNAPLEDDFLFLRPASSPWYWRVELREQPGWTNNVDQVANGPASFSNRLTLSGFLRYTFPTQTQILLRSQHYLFNYFNVSDRDQFLSIPLSPTVSQWFWNQLNVYAGYIPIFSTSIGQATPIQHLDHDLMFGAAWYQPIEGGHYFFGGYQFDYLHADLESYRNLGHLFFAGYRHHLRDDLYAFADAYFQPRGYTNTPDFLDEIRFGGGLALQWQIFKPWLILEGRGDYNQIINFTSADRSAGIFSFGINLISALESAS